MKKAEKKFQKQRMALKQKTEERKQERKIRPDLQNWGGKKPLADELRLQK